MLEKVLVVLVAFWVLGAMFGEDDEPDSNALAGVEAAEPAATPAEPADEGSPAEAESAGVTPNPEPERKPATYRVTQVVDGDTIELGNGQPVRLVGIDTPERGDCGYDRATASLQRLVLGKRVRLTVSDEETDRYGRLLRYVDVGGVDAGLRQINRGVAIARYDSRDGYGHHPREKRYVAADKATTNLTCPKPKPQPLVRQQADSCASGYSPCIPPYPPDLDCADVAGPITVTGLDPHGLDADGDGVACES